MFYERLQDLCKERGEKLTTVVVEILGMSRGNLSRWKNGGIPKGDTLSTLAEYFGVSTDYLLGNESRKEKCQTILDNPELTLSADEKWFILKLRELDKEGRTIVESALVEETRRMDRKKATTTA